MRNKNAAWFKRLLSGLLAVVMCVSLLPISVFADDIGGGGGGGSAPSTIKLDTVGKRHITYTPQHNYDYGKGPSLVHDMKFMVNGESMTGFCMDHGKNLNDSHRGLTWNMVGSGPHISQGDVRAYFLDYYYYTKEESQKIYQKLGGRDPNAAEFKALEEGTSPYQPSYGVGANGFWYSNTKEIFMINGYVQAFLWAYEGALKSGRNGELDCLVTETVVSPFSANTPSVQKAISIFAAERNAAAKAAGVEATLDHSKELLTTLIIDAKGGQYGHRDYYLYEPDGRTDIQRILTTTPGEPEDEPQKYDVMLKVHKIDAVTGHDLPGAVFEVYGDSQRQSWKGKMTTGADGWAYVKINRVANVGETTNLYVVETSAPDGFKKKDGVIQVRVDEGHDTKETAINIMGADGIDFPNDTGTPTPDNPGGPGTPPVRKIDAKTQEGVGPCTFHFEGTNADGEYMSFDRTTDNEGNLNIQWGRPSESDTYVEPGEFTVTEKTPPPGYDNTTEARHLVLEYDETTGEQRMSGPLVFENDKLTIIEFRKVSSEGFPLPGATIEIYKDTELYAKEVTGANGEIIVQGPDGKGVHEGTYLFVETEAPEGYLLPARNWVEVHIDPADEDQQSPVIVTMVNYKNPEIVIVKYENGTLSPLQGAEFEVMIDGAILGKFKTNAEGKIIINSDVYGKFLRDKGDYAKGHWTVSVRETSAPDGYLIDDTQWQTAELWEGEKLKEFTFEDTPYPEILIYKRDAETGELLDNCSFNVKINGVDIGNFVSGQNGNEKGTVKIDYEKYARFLQDINGKQVLDKGWNVTVTELEMPDKYNKDRQQDSTGGDGYTISKVLGPDQKLVEFTFRDHEYRDIKVTKLDAETGWPLAGATFNLHCVAADSPLSPGNISDRQLTTDASGYVTFVDVPNGTYFLEEIKAPNGYEENPVWSTGDKGNKTTIIVTSDSDPIIEVTAKNEPKSGFRLLKVDADTRQPIPGVVFEFTPVSPLTGSPIEATTDENGVIVIENLNIGQGGNGVKEGTYIAVEKSAPKPYRVDPTPHTVEVRNGHDATQITLNNYADGMLNIVKIDSVTGEPLAGAYFRIQKASGEDVAEVGPTGRNGYVSWAGFEPGGSYKVTEIRSPEGHVLDTTPQTFTVPEDVSGWTHTLFFGNAPLSNMWLRKIDAETGLGLKGAIFKITTGDGTIIRQNAETDEGGYIKLNNLDEGTYLVQETKAPTGYILDDTVRTVVLRKGYTEIVKIENRQPGGIRIRKVDSATGDPLEGAEFQLYDINDTPIGGVVKTGIDGYATWNNLEGGQYQVEEVAAPKGYIRDTHKRKIEVKDFVTTQYEWKNSQEATITVYKRDGDTLVPLGGAKFEIRDMDGGVVQTLTTDLTGSATSSRLPLGWYRVVETEAPRGYTLNPDEHLVEVKDGTPVSIDHLDWSDKVLIVHKRDAITKQPLTGAWFELQTVDGKLVQEQFGTDASGVCVTKALEPGKYYLVETKAPEGYVLDETKRLIEIEEGKSTSVTVDNIPQSVIAIYKTDGHTGEPLMGVEFTIYDKHNKALEIIKTDITGWAYSKIMDPGDYVVKETQTIQGYTIDDTVHHVEMEEGKNFLLNIKNMPDTSLKIVKIDSVTKKPLAGARFELRYDTGHGDCTYIGEYVTDEYGKVFTEPLTPGFYMIKELDAPKGYAVMEEELRVCVKAPGNNSDGGSQADGLNEVIIENQPLATLIVKKVDSTNNKPIAGTKFRLETADHGLIGELETDSNGEATWHNLTAGHYIVTELIASEGYDLAGCPSQTVTVEYGKDNYVTFKDNPYASLIITLQDKHTGDYLLGGSFEVRRLSDMTIVYENKTDVTGTLVVGNLQPGWYEVTQKFAPDGWTVIDQVIKVQILAGKQQTIHFYDETAGLVIEKVDSKDATKMLEGARFKLVRSEDNFTVGEYVTSTDGKVQVKDLAPGLYTVQEIVAPVGYEIDDATPKMVHVKGGQAAHVTFTDTARASITINVQDATDKSPVAGCVVEVWKQNGELVKSFISDKTGMVETEKMDAGYYVLKLVTLADGYRCENTEVTVHLTDSTEVTHTFELVSKGTLTVFSQDAAHAVIQGMKFTVTQVDGKVIGSYETGTDGKYVVSGLDAGWYVITETKAPDGYDADATTGQRVQVTAKANTDVTFTHKAHVSSDVSIGVIVPGTSAGAGMGLSGCVVEIYTTSGILVGKYTTDNTGLVHTTGLATGTYVVKLVSVTEGYTTLISQTTINVTAGQSSSFTFEAIAQGGISVTSVGPDGKQIHGMKFEVKTKTGVTVGTYETDENGNRVINDLAAGWYVVTEISTPGNMDSEKQSFDVEVKAGSVAKVTFTHVSKGSCVVNVIDGNTQAGLNGVIVEVWKQNGNLVNTYTTDATGKFSLVDFEAGYYELRITKLIDGYTCATMKQTIEIKSGESLTVKFECVSAGTLRVVSKDNAGQVIAGMKFTVTDLNGGFVDSGVTGADGTYIVAGIEPGWYLVKETKAPEGFNIGENAEQRIEVKAGTSAEVVFEHAKTFGMQIRTTCGQTGAAVEGVTYKVTTLEGADKGTYTSDAAGLAFASLAPGWYIITPVSAPKGYAFADKTARNIEVKGDSLTVVDFVVNQQSSIRVKIVDGTTGKPVYNVRVQLKNGTTCIKEYYTNDQGYINIDQSVLAGGYVLEMISAPDGYIVDKIPHSIDVLNGETTEIVWKLYKDAGQIQVVVTSADYNKTLDKAAGQPLEGAVFEITNADTYQVVGQMISDSRGIAASSGLPIGRYTVKMITAPAYYALNEGWNPEIRIKINNDVVRTETTCTSAILGTSISQKTNSSARSGSTIRVDILTADNISSTRLDDYYVHIKVPTDAARITTLNPGTWNGSVWYKITYKTNARGYSTLAENLNSSNPYTFDLSTRSLGLQAGEYVTDVRFEFGTVPSGFKMATKTSYSLYIVSGLANGYKLINRLEMGGRMNQTVVNTNHVTNIQNNPYGTLQAGIPDGSSPLGGGQAAISAPTGQWTTSTSVWTVNITNTGTLPKTGY